MNLYIRYFGNEALTHSVEEAVEFLKSLDLGSFEVDEELVEDLQSYATSTVAYPKRYKVHTHAYFIVIKTTAETMEEFKMNNSKNQGLLMDEENGDTKQKKDKVSVMSEEQVGWYDATLTFKRVIAIPETNKFQYKDTDFRVKCMANSPMDCYQRIVDHLRNRPEIDSRSQFPSAKGRSFSYVYLGEIMPQEIGA